MMDGSEKSDRGEGLVKSLNKVERSAAERMEGRHLVEGRSKHETRSGHRTGTACHLNRSGPAAQLHGSLKPQTAQWYHPRQGTRCGKAARRDLCGGRRAIAVPDRRFAPNVTACHKPLLPAGIKSHAAMA